MIIYKYNIDVSTGSVHLFDWPVGSKVLDVQVQNGEPYMWVLHLAQSGLAEQRCFVTFGTGQQVDQTQADPNELEYVATYQQLGGSFVGHVFELKNDPC